MSQKAKGVYSLTLLAVTTVLVLGCSGDDPVGPEEVYGIAGTVVDSAGDPVENAAIGLIYQMTSGQLLYGNIRSNADLPTIVIQVSLQSAAILHVTIDD